MVSVLVENVVLRQDRDDWSSLLVLSAGASVGTLGAHAAGVSLSGCYLLLRLLQLLEADSLVVVELSSECSAGGQGLCWSKGKRPSVFIG